MVFGYLFWFIYNIFFVVFPLLKSAESLRKPLKEKLQQWLVYWIFFISTTYLENFFSWMPFYGFFQMIFLIANFFPPIASRLRSLIILTVLREVKRVCKKIWDEYDMTTKITPVQQNLLHNENYFENYPKIRSLHQQSIYYFNFLKCNYQNFLNRK